MAASGAGVTQLPYVDAEGFARWCELCGCPLSPNILDNFWIHDGDSACQASSDDHGIQRYNHVLPTLITLERRPTMAEGDDVQRKQFGAVAEALLSSISGEFGSDNPAPAAKCVEYIVAALQAAFAAGEESGLGKAEQAAENLRNQFANLASVSIIEFVVRAIRALKRPGTAGEEAQP
jgi:hypothetical protein